jgi:hypothetical protein
MIEAIITDITRLTRGTDVCIAATADGRQIRLDNPRPTEEWVSMIGGLQPGSIIRTEWEPASSPRRPHVEDGVWFRETFSKRGQISEDELFDLLDQAAYDSVRKAFGEPLVVGTQGSCGFTPGQGSRSLASIRVVRASLTLPWSQRQDKVRVSFRDVTDQWKQVPLQDLCVNQHRMSCLRCMGRFGEFVQSDFPTGPAILRVGLAREQVLGPHPNGCWLQVNHVLRKNARKRHFV